MRISLILLAPQPFSIHFIVYDVLSHIHFYNNLRNFWVKLFWLKPCSCEKIVFLHVCMTLGAGMFFPYDQLLPLRALCQVTTFQLNVGLDHAHPIVALLLRPHCCCLLGYFNPHSCWWLLVIRERCYRGDLADFYLPPLHQTS